MTAHTQSLRGLYAVTDSSLTADGKLLTAVESAIRGGARLLQYRDKSPDQPRRETEARALLQLCHNHNVMLVINDDVALAASIGADGVHLGKEDAALHEARVTLGPRSIIGVSCYASLERATAAAHAGADYVAFGSFFGSPTKPGTAVAPPELLSRAKQCLRLPIVAIGGITPSTAPTLVEHGADALAVISALFDRGDVATAAREFAGLFSRSRSVGMPS